jgi:hypothetical protein
MNSTRPSLPPVRYGAHKIQFFDPILNHLNPLHVIKLYFSTIKLITPPENFYASFFSAYRILKPRLVFHDFISKIVVRDEYKFFTNQYAIFSIPLISYILFPGSIYSPPHFIFKNSEFIFLPQRKASTPYKTISWNTITRQVNKLLKISW